MFERLARWLLLYLALALTLLGRPSEPCDTQRVEDEALRAAASDPSLISESRRVPSLQRVGDGIRSHKSQATPVSASAAVTRIELAPVGVDITAEPTQPTTRASQTVAYAASARGPPVLAG